MIYLLSILGLIVFWWLSGLLSVYLDKIMMAKVLNETPNWKEAKFYWKLGPLGLCLMLVAIFLYFLEPIIKFITDFHFRLWLKVIGAKK